MGEMTTNTSLEVLQFRSILPQFSPFLFFQTATQHQGASNMFTSKSQIKALARKQDECGFAF